MTAVEKWPTGVRNRCEFFESIGIDPSSVLQDGINEYGFRVMVLDAHGKRVYNSDGFMEAVTTPWPNGVEDFRGFLRAEQRDYLGTRQHPEELPIVTDTTS